MFDRGYTIVCRDAATSVGQVYALRVRGGDPVARLAALRASRATCEAAGPGQIEDLGAIEASVCRLGDADVGYRVYVHRAGDTVYVAEGLAGYDGALRLALRSVVADRVMPGEVQIAMTGAGDPVAFARVQAGALDRRRALAEAYRRNNAGNFAESAEYFAVLTEGRSEVAARIEALANEALQRSNLGRHAEADALFAQAAPMASADPVAARRYRNYRAMHLLNQGFAAEAIDELNRPLPDAGPSGGVGDGVIDSTTSARLSAESPGAQRLAGLEGLTLQDKARVLDGQARQIRAAILRQQGNDGEAEAILTRALDELIAIRGGRIAATIWLRAQIFGDLAGIAEARGDRGAAESRHREAIALLDSNYPDSPALFSAKGRLAGFLLRTGRADEALLLYREVVAVNTQSGVPSPALARVLAPYFALLAERAADPAAVAELFAALQALARPGVAQTQAVLARSLSGGSDESARLFRQSLNLTRSIERERVALARLDQSGQAPDRAAALRTSIAQLRQDQVATQARLAEFPRYRMVAEGTLSLADLQAALRPGEAYYKLTQVEDALYAVFITPASARAYRLALSAGDLDTRVDGLRATISRVQNGQQLTFPFNVQLAHQLFEDLFAPVRTELGQSTHLIFEPDGAMLRLPPNVLVMDEGSVAAYRARVAASRDNEFDFRGASWLGRDREVSTSVSPRAFREVRNAPPSRASAQYLGLGQNAPIAGAAASSSGAVRGLGGDACAWPAAAWGNPISAAELVSARDRLAAETPGGAEIVTGAAFSDSALRARTDLDRFRILHFATHGLVTAPRPDCPSRPALLTSFGPGESDGLLSFAEIFDLQLDADIVVLSACDTASRAGLTATEEAGISGGGDFALDGLVRAFVGAGARLVVASHWPVPDSYNATQRLITGMFTAAPGTSVGRALRDSERALMDEADTSHPYYWAGFAVIGDGAMPVIRTAGAAAGAD
jgi:CHAT domain-containing protein